MCSVYQDPNYIEKYYSNQITVNEDNHYLMNSGKYIKDDKTNLYYYYCRNQPITSTKCSSSSSISHYHQIIIKIIQK